MSGTTSGTANDAAPTGISSSSTVFDRRQMLRLGGFSIAAAVVISACSDNTIVGTPISGSAPALGTAPSGVYSDEVLLRTATSLQYSDIDAINGAVQIPGIDEKVSTLAKAYAATLKTQADTLAKLTTQAGGTPFEKPNPRFSEVVITPSLKLLSPTVSATPGNDAARFIHAVVTHAGETLQFFVQLLNKPELRGAVLQIGAVHARASAVLASLISPENIVTSSQVQVSALPTTTTASTTPASADAQVTVPTQAPPTTKAPVAADIAIYQVPAAFGVQSAVQVALGKVGSLDDTIKRSTLNFDTLYLNSFVYDN